MSRTEPREFVAVYMEMGGDLDSVAGRLGVGRGAVYQRVRKMRKAGVKLPVERKAYNKYDVKSLNSLIKEYKNVK